MATGNATLGSIRGKIIIDYDGAGVAKAGKDVDNLKNKGRQAGASYQESGNMIAAAGAVIAGGLALAVNSAANFEQGLANIRAVSGATEQDMEALRKKALQLGSDTKYSATEAAAAMEELAKAGISLPDILNGAADAAVALAAAGGIALPEAATIMSNAMNQFGLKASELPRIADLIAGAANASAIDVGQFGYSLSQVGAVANLAGLSFRDTAVAIALLGNAGIVGSDAGTSLKTMLQNLIPTTKQQIELSRQLGLITKDGSNAFFDAQGKVKSLAEISQVLQNATKNLTKEQKLAAFETLFGSDAIRGAAILAENGAEGFNKMAGAMEKVKAADVAATRMDTLKGKLETLKGSIETAAIILGTILIPPITKMVQWLTRLAESFTKLSPSTQRTILIITGVAAAILIFIGVVFKIIQVIRVFQTVWVALNISFLFSPIGLIILAIIALIAVIVLIATKTTWFQTIWNAIWGFMKGVGAWFAGPFANFFVQLWAKIMVVLNGIWSIFKFIWGLIVAYFTFVWGIIKGVLNFFAPAFQAAFNLIVSIIKLAWSIITAIIQVGVTIWKAIIMAVWNFIAPFIKFYLDTVVAYFTWVWNTLVSIWNFLWNAVVSTIRWVWGFIGPYVMGAIKIVVDVITRSWNWIKNTSESVWNGITSFFTGIWNFIVGVFQRGVQFITNYLNGIRAIVDRVRGFFDGLKNAASGGVGSLISFVSQIPQRILNAIGNLGSSLYSKGRDLIQGLINGIRAMGGRIRDALVGLLPGPLKSMAGMLGLASPSKLFRQWGIWTVQGFINGIQGMYSRLRSTMGNVAALVASPGTVDVVGAVNGSAGLSGPSTGAPTPPAAPAITVVSQPLVIADFGTAGRQMVKTTIAEEPELVSASAAKGDQGRSFLSPGRG